MGHDEEEKKLHQFLDKEGGKIIRTKIECSVNTIQIGNIQSQLVALHNSFETAIKELNQAENEDQENEAMYNLIKNFGTHFAQKTIMGIGAEFETRVTNEESKTMDKATIKSCTSGGFNANLAGFKIESSHVTCPANWKNSTSRLNQKGIARFVSTSYGIPSAANELENWTKLISDLYQNGRLHPIPIKQTLVPIYELLNTTVVRNIPSTSKDKVDIEKILRIAKKGFSEAEYCKMFGCRRPSCLKNVRFNGEDFYETNIPSLTAANDRVYQSKNSNYLYYNDGSWKIGPDFNGKF